MRSKELWLVEKNRATVKPVSSVPPCWMKTYSESRIELQNLQILKKMLEKSSQWKLVVTVNLEAIWFEFCGNERGVNDGGDFCLLWLVILKSASYSVGDTF